MRITLVAGPQEQLPLVQRYVALPFDLFHLRDGRGRRWTLSKYVTEETSLLLQLQTLFRQASPTDPRCAGLGLLVEDSKGAMRCVYLSFSEIEESEMAIDEEGRVLERVSGAFYDMQPWYVDREALHRHLAVSS